MTLKSKSVKLNLCETASEKHHINLQSKYTLNIKTAEKNDILEIVDTERELNLSILLTPSGPVISAKGMKFDISAMEKISLKSKKIVIGSQEETLITSSGKLSMASQDDININSDENIKLNSKLIYLN